MNLRQHWRPVVIVLGCLWFGGVAVWAAQDFVDHVPVGTNYNLDPPTEVDVAVQCHAPLKSTPRPDEPLPALDPQPADHPPLAYTREPCRTQRDSVRKALVIDAVVFVVLVGAVSALHFRAPRRDDRASLTITADAP